MWDTGKVQIQRRRLLQTLSAPVQSSVFQVELLLSPLAKLLQKEPVGLVESARLYIRQSECRKNIKKGKIGRI